jgi:nuclear pore complex protein Nup85
VLLRVPISFKAKTGDHGDVNATVHSGEVPAALKAVIETCHEYGRESVRRMVCTVSVLLPIPISCAFGSGYVTQIAAGNFLKHREYGLAVSYATSAENWTWLGRIVDSILAEYIEHGLSISPALL